MTKNAHKEPVVCPVCGELIVITASGYEVDVPAHPDAAFPTLLCPVTVAAVVARFILL